MLTIHLPINQSINQSIIHSILHITCCQIQVGQGTRCTLPILVLLVFVSTDPRSPSHVIPIFRKGTDYPTIPKDANRLVSTHAQRLKQSPAWLGIAICQKALRFPRIWFVIRLGLLPEGAVAKYATAPRMITVTKMIGSTPVNETTELV